MGLFRKVVSISVASTGIPAVSFHSQTEKNTKALKALRNDQSQQHLELLNALSSQGQIVENRVNAESTYASYRPSSRSATSVQRTNTDQLLLLSALEQLEDFYELFQQEVLTDDEFTSQKKVLLAEYIGY
jgi:hypothetical protein